MGSDTTFSVVRKGYSIAEVDNHLRSLRRESHHGNDQLQARVEELEAELADARRREEAVQITLVAATKTREEMLLAAQDELSQAAGEAKTSAEDIVSEAQFEAFRLVTQAKEDAEETIRAAKAEAARIAAGAEASTDLPPDMAAVRESVEARARAQLEEMRAEAQATIDAIRAEAAADIAIRDQRIAELQSQVQRLELPAVAPAEVPEPLVPAPAVEPPPSPIARPEEEPPRTKDGDDQPTGAPLVTVEDTDVRPLSDRPARGSFYSRRSARLPRIGSDAANGALAAVSAMRSASRNGGDEGAEGVPNDATEDMAMQTA